ncbi:uncharacterized protein VTP21DRAFT_686 [Calcarisporiella thermophila]|uniref:uncharacterized protein n=1 Tax=Calcarisporiella thermophila TaxID=911321 RepID=UPI003744746D
MSDLIPTKSALCLFSLAPFAAMVPTAARLFWAWRDLVVRYVKPATWMGAKVHKLGSVPVSVTILQCAVPQPIMSSSRVHQWGLLWSVLKTAQRVSKLE